MRERNLILLLFIILLIFPSIQAEETNLESNIEDYVNHLLYIYRELAEHDTNFDITKYEDDMYIYMKNTDCMRVFCFNGNAENTIILVFDKNSFLTTPIGVEIVFYFNEDIESYTGFDYGIMSPNITVYSKASFISNNTIFTPELVHCVHLNDILNDRYVNSKNLAEKFYKHNKKSAKIDAVYNPFINENWDTISSNKKLYEQHLKIYSNSNRDNCSFSSFLNDFDLFKEKVLHQKHGIFYYIIYDGNWFSILSFLINLMVLSIGFYIEIIFLGIKKFPKSTLAIEPFLC